MHKIVIIGYAFLLINFIINKKVTGKFNWGYFIGGFLFGLSNEIQYEPCFKYDTAIFGLCIYKDVPLSVIVGWGNLFLISLFLSDLVHMLLKIQKKWWSLFLLDIFFFIITGLPTEIYLKNSGYWSYMFWQEKTIVHQLSGYFLIALVSSPMCRWWNNIISPNIPR